MVSITNLRKDHIGLYGYNRDTTPNIDELFQNSLIFENAFVPSPWTLPNGVTLFTSQYPYTHKISSRYNGNEIPPQYKTLAEILKYNGYKTSAFTGGGDYNTIYGFDRGFDEYYNRNNFSGISDIKDNAIEWLKKNKNEKFFLFLQGFDTHCPFDPPYPYNEKYKTVNSDLDNSVCYWNLDENNIKNDNGKIFYSVFRQGKKEKHPEKIFLTEDDKEKLINMYDGEIKHADDSLGEFFSNIKELELDKNTVIIFLSEHGDLIGDDGRFMRTDILGTFTDKVLNIPLIIKHPNIKMKKKITGLVNLVDIMPTLLEILDADIREDEFEGMSLIPLIKNNKIINNYVFGGLIYEGDEKSLFFRDIREVNVIRNFEYKLIKEQIYNLKNKNLVRENYKFFEIKNDLLEKNDLIKEKDRIIDIDKFKIELNNWQNKFIL